MFTQRNEEKYILQFFQNIKGRFLDIGAYDGECFSTTRALALGGWGGVCVEPSPSVLPALETLYGSNPKIDILKTAIADVNGEIDFYDSNGDMISTVDPAHVEKWKEKAGATYNIVKVESMTPTALFERVGYDFNFISLDVEGTNLDIFKQIPFACLTKTKMICVEFDYKEVQMTEIVEQYKFRLYHKTAENLLFVR